MAKVTPLKGWVLVTREDQERIDGKREIGEQYICWHEIFDTRIDAFSFAVKNKWPKPWWAKRAIMQIAE
jgi:hypothetical protein